MTNACKAIISYGFDRLGLKRVQILCDAGNMPACAIPERMGFRKEEALKGYYRAKSGPRDCARYVMQATDWKLR